MEEQMRRLMNVIVELENLFDEVAQHTQGNDIGTLNELWAARQHASEAYARLMWDQVKKRPN